jgi:hypothetical protein
MIPPTAESAPPPSLWHLKPWWCQPWSIVLTGITLPAIAWSLFHRWWITAPVVCGVVGWWLVFLVWVPQQYRRWAQQLPPDANPPTTSATEREI